ncbi:MAG: adenylate/guanylate cyclase domain-containing protein [bacterium]
MSHPLNWLYRRLGSWYPRVFVTAEMLVAFPVVLGALALVSFYYNPGPDNGPIVLASALALTAVAVAAVLARVLRRLRPVTRYLRGDHTADSTAAAWTAAVDLPTQLVRRDFFVPVAITLPLAILAVVLLGLSWYAVFPLLLVSLIVVGYAAILHYLALEVAMRPILYDINEGLTEPVRIERPDIPLRVKLLASLPLINVITGMTVAALTSEGGSTASLGLDVLIALFVSFTISLELTILLSRSILRPIEDLEAATERIRQGRFDEHVPVTTADEFGELSSAFNQMIDGLAERERLREAFGTYLDEDVANYIIRQDYDPEGAEAEVSLLFCDVENFAATAASASAPQIVSRLNELYECVVPIIARHRGHVDQFIGDGLLAVFGAPERTEDHADRAVQCAVEIARTVNSRKPGGFSVKVGVNSGTVVVGSIGGAGRLAFSVIGDAVNVASRVEEMTRETGDQVLITGDTRVLLSETIEVVSRGDREIKGTGRSMEIYAPVVPYAVETEPGDEVGDPLGAPQPGGLGRPQKPGEGLGRRSPGGRLGQSAPPAPGGYTLPG